MLVLLVVACLVAAAAVLVAVAVIAAARRRVAAPRPAPADPFADRDAGGLRGDPRALRPGDLVEMAARSSAVRGSLRFTEGAWSWSEHLLDDATGGKVWLSVEEDARIWPQARQGS
jgi:hypothetical protein